MKEHLHQECYARSCREIEELRIRCNGEGNYWRKTKMGRISYAAWSGITNSESVLLRSWLTEQLWHTYVPHQALITPSSKKPSREVGMPRNTRENVSIPGNGFDCQHARRDLDELHNDSRKWAISLAFLRKEGIENRGSEKTIAINTFTLLFSKSEERTSRRQISLMSMTDDAFGYLDLYSSGMTIPSHLHSDLHL